MIDIEKLKDIIQSYCAACDTESEEYNKGFQECGTLLLKELEKLYKVDPISDNLEEASNKWLPPQLDKSYEKYGETRMLEFTQFDGYAMLDAIEFGTDWQYQKDRLEFAKLKAKEWQDGFDAGAEAKEKMMEKACEWLKEQEEMVGVSFQNDFIEHFRNYMEGGEK